MNPELTNDRQDMKQKLFEPEDPNNDSAGDDSDNDKPARRSGRRKIKIEYIEDKNRRHITFSKRKAGIMKKAYELSTLTGTQVLLLVVSETGLVYTFTTVKLQPIVTKPEGKNLIQACLNAPDPMSNEQAAGDASYGNSSPQSEDKKLYDDKPESSSAATAAAPSQQPQQPQQSQPPQQQQQNAPNGYNGGNGSNPGYHPSQSPYSQPSSQPAGNGGNYSGHPGYMNPAGQSGGYQSAQGQPTPNAYGQIPQPAFYGNQQQHYMPHQQHQQHQQQQQQQQQPHGYWQPAGPGSLPRQDQSPIIDDKRGVKK